MKNIDKLIVILGIMLVCINGMHGQNSSVGFVFSGTINDSLSAPVRMAIDNNDHIYVTDAFRKKIVKYDASGNFSGSIVNVGSPVSIAINEANQVFFGDGETGKIFKINSNGSVTELYNGTVFPSSMVFCSDGLLYVSDSKLQRVIVLDLSGNVIRTIGAGTLIYPTGITFDKKNNRILVAEHGGIGNGFNPVVKVRIFGLMGNLITSFGSHGNGDGKFYRIQGLAVGRCGEIYVPEPYQGNVNVFTENTVFATRFGQYGDSLSQLRIPLDIAINSQDKIFITAENNGKIEVFNIDYVLPTANITCGNKTICFGATTEIPVHFTGTPPWAFTYTVDGINPTTITNTSNNPYVLTVMAPGNYQVIAISDSSKVGTCFSGNAVVTVNSVIPTSTITTGQISFCPGQPAGISINLTGTPPWSFTYTHNGTNPQTVSDVATTPYLLNVFEAGSYQITELSGQGCVGSVFSGVANVTANPSPTAMIATGNTNICEGSSTDLAIVFTGTAPWSFTYTINNTNPTTILDITDNPFLLPVSLPGIYQVVHVQDAYCEGSISSGSPEITVKSLPTAHISSGNTSICPGDTVAVIIDLTGEAPWTFTYTMNDLNPETVTGITSTPYILPVSNAGIYQLTALSDAICSGTSLTGSAIISENPVPVVSLGPTLSLCAGDSVVLDAGSFLLYLWNDSTTAPVLTAYDAGIYSLTVTDYNGCRNSASKTITSSSLPTSVITSGNANICVGETTDIAIALTGIPPWTFTYTVNGFNPQTINNIMTSPYVLNVYKAGVYQITETTDAGCKNIVSAGSATITVNSLPTYNFLSGNASLCAGQTTNIIIDFTGTPPWNITYTVNGLNPVTINGIINNPFILPVSHGGTYEIIALSDASCYGIGYMGMVTITENPLPVVNLGLDVTIDAGEVLTLDAGQSLAAYLWSDGSNGRTLEVTSAGDYGVTVADYNGCSNSGVIHVDVIVPANKDLQNITVTDSRCFSATQMITVAGGGMTFAVQNGGNATLIAGQNIIFLPGARADSGAYMHGYITPDNTYCGGVTPPMVLPVNPVTTSNGACNDSTASMYVSAVAAATSSRPLENVLKLYPNPSTGLITVEIRNPGNLDLRIDINDMAGRHVYSKTVNSIYLSEKIDLGGFTQGIYAVRLSSGKITKTTKLVLID